MMIDDRHVLCHERVRFVGDAVAVVAADTVEAAEEALELDAAWIIPSLELPQGMQTWMTSQRLPSFCDTLLSSRLQKGLILALIGKGHLRVIVCTAKIALIRRDIDHGSHDKEVWKIQVNKRRQVGGRKAVWPKSTNNFNSVVGIWIWAN
jgi:hypothetical protein